MNDILEKSKELEKQILEDSEPKVDEPNLTEEPKEEFKEKVQEKLKEKAGEVKEVLKDFAKTAEEELDRIMKDIPD